MPVLSFSGSELLLWLGFLNPIDRLEAIGSCLLYVVEFSLLGDIEFFLFLDMSSPPRFFESAHSRLRSNDGDLPTTLLPSSPNMIIETELCAPSYGRREDSTGAEPNMVFVEYRLLALISEIISILFSSCVSSLSYISFASYSFAAFLTAAGFML